MVFIFLFKNYSLRFADKTCSRCFLCGTIGFKVSERVARFFPFCKELSKISALVLDVLCDKTTRRGDAAVII